MSNCGKRTYPDKKAAVTAFNKVMRRRRNRPKNIRRYYCYQCQGWHLTHKEERDL